ncbi:actin-like [Lucilia sericata]|uniref:actin-like n=1 Tax=Lucilia sericata TaxID=13632 RepID=UPI0018A8323F|nr:actin-like [Lucilia sericata]XP_037822172.1 actin-like [Lucilia sericata]
MAFSCWPRHEEKKIETSIIETQTLETDFSLPLSDVIIIDCGSNACKVGFSGDNKPRHLISTIVGRPKQGAAVGQRSVQDSFVGFEAQQRHAVLNLNTPIERGIITNWNDIEVYFDYLFHESLQLDPAGYRILLTETLNNPKKNREKLLELMLEKFRLKSFFLTPAPPLALYAYGFYTGVALDSGEGQTHIVPVYEGFAMPHSTRYIPLGGKDINKMLENILAQNSDTLNFLQKSTDREFLRDIKEQLCYVAFDYREEFAKPALKPKTYRLPDGNYVNLSSELFRCTEALFEPTMLDVKTGGIHENIFRSIHLSDSSIRHLLYGHIVLSGGNTLFPGLQHRLANEMRLMSEPDATINIHAKSDRKNAVFLGASLLSSLAKFKDMMITYSEYFETGPAIVNRKCF